MSRRRTAFTNWYEYLALRGVTGFMNCFAVEQNLATAAWLGSTFCRISPRRLARAVDNVRLSFPDWSEERVRRVAERSVCNMFQIGLVDAMIMPRKITRTSWPRYLSVGRLQGALKRLVCREPTIFITGHCGNWELLGYALAVLDYPLHALARPLDNPLINEWFMGIREARGMRIITKWGATPVVERLVAKGGRAAFIADQNAGDGGMFVPFFGRLASTYKSIGLLAMKYEVPIVVGMARRIGDRFEYELSASNVIRPEEWCDHVDPLFYITARYNYEIEKMIRRAPDQYLWIHRRWKSRPRHERLGRPMPSRTIAKLETLPWVSPDDLAGLVKPSGGRTPAAGGA